MLREGQLSHNMDDEPTLNYGKGVDDTMRHSYSVRTQDLMKLETRGLSRFLYRNIDPGYWTISHTEARRTLTGGFAIRKAFGHSKGGEIMDGSKDKFSKKDWKEIQRYHRENQLIERKITYITKVSGGKLALSIQGRRK